MPPKKKFRFLSGKKARDNHKKNDVVSASVSVEQLDELETPVSRNVVNAFVNGSWEKAKTCFRNLKSSKTDHNQTKAASASLPSKESVVEERRWSNSGGESRRTQAEEMGNVSASSKISACSVKEASSKEESVKQGASWMSSDEEMPVQQSLTKKTVTDLVKSDTVKNVLASMLIMEPSKDKAERRRRRNSKNEFHTPNAKNEIEKVSSSSTSSDWSVNVSARKVYMGKGKFSGRWNSDIEISVKNSEKNKNFSLVHGASSMSSDEEITSVPQCQCEKTETNSATTDTLEHESTSMRIALPSEDNAVQLNCSTSRRKLLLRIAKEKNEKVSSSSTSSDWSLKNTGRKVNMDKEKLAGGKSSNEKLAVKNSGKKKKSSLVHRLFFSASRLRNLEMAAVEESAFVPLLDATISADEVESVSLDVDESAIQRLSVFTSICDVESMGTTCPTATPIAIISSNETVSVTSTAMSITYSEGGKPTRSRCITVAQLKKKRRSKTTAMVASVKERVPYRRLLRKCKNSCFNDDELQALDESGMPEPVSQQMTIELTQRIFDRFHEFCIVCAVCNQFVRVTKSKLLSVNKLPDAMFILLQAPNGAADSLPSLHPLLVKQYDVSGFFPDDPRFEKLLLSPDGVLRHKTSCVDPTKCTCSPHIYMCDQSTTSSCFVKLKMGKLPKFAIANGNWVGLLPPELREMTFGSRSVMRPVQTFGRITAFTGSSGPGGSTLKGHVYSTRLKTAMVMKKVPIVPGQTPVRVLVVSPFASDAVAFWKGKIASTKEDYVIEPTKIKALHHFWRDVRNDVVKNISFDEESFLNLPKDATSTDVFLVEKDGLDKVCVDVGEFEDRTKKTVSTGGDSLLRSIEEEVNATMISCTITIGDGGDVGSNVTEHEQLAKLLPSFDCVLSADTSNKTYVIRPGEEFVSDSLPMYLETLYPDFFPFGRNGFDEARRQRISKKALVAYYANLSTRQFQRVDFVLPVYDYIARTTSSNMARIRAYLPSRNINPDGSIIPRAEAYGRISNEDLKKAALYQSECVKCKLFGQRLPRPPQSLNGLATTFFTDQKIVNQTTQHSQAAAQKNRQDVYAAHANNGKAHIWLTVSPDDAKSFQVLWFALGSAQSRPHNDAIPIGSKRFSVLSDHPVAAALNFQHILDIVVENVIGWCQRVNRPYKRGGLFGVPKAWLRVVEEQSRLTLHTHMLIWLCGHGCIESQLDQALKHDNDNAFGNYSSNTIPMTATHYVDDITEKLAKNIESFIHGELQLPEVESNFVLECDFCLGEKLKIVSEEKIEVMRKSDLEFECKILLCVKCRRTVTVSDKLSMAIKHGYTRLESPMPTEKDVDALIWNGLRPKPAPEDKKEHDLWTLDLACIQMQVNQHDWRHRKSCFKNGRVACRYGLPLAPTDGTEVNAIYMKRENNTNDSDIAPRKGFRINELMINVRKRAPFIFMTDCNAPLMSVLNCNNCVKYVKDQKVSMYYGAYSTKHSTDCEQSLVEAMKAIERHGDKINKEREEAEKKAEDNRKKTVENDEASECDPLVHRRSDFSIGLGKLRSSVRASTKGDTIGAPMAAFVLLGNNIFAMSHRTEVLPLTQALAYLEKENIYATITRFGQVKAIIHDYVFRSDKIREIEALNFWNFVRTQEICQLKISVDDKSERFDLYEEEETSTHTIHKFKMGHPFYRSQGHRKRRRICWTRYLGKRLPDLHDLEENSNLLNDQRDERRTDYAKGVLTMFVPFRDKNDLVADGESWWEAYVRQKASLYDDKNIKRTLDSIQNFYESFCRSSPDSEALDFSKKDLQEIVHEESDIVENNDEEDLPIDVEEDDAIKKNDTALDPFIQAINSLPYSILDLPVKNWPSTVSHCSAKRAVDALQSKKKNMFTLPGRGSLGFPIEDSNPTMDNPKFDTHLDRPLGTRIQLLEHLADAIDSHKHEDVLNDGTEPE